MRIPTVPEWLVGSYRDAVLKMSCRRAQIGQRVVLGLRRLVPLDGLLLRVLQQTEAEGLAASAGLLLL